MMTFIMLLMSVVVLVVIFLIFYQIVRAKTKDIGIIKAVGGSSALVLGLLLRETVLLAVLGTGVGIAMTYGTQWLMQHAVPASLVQETVYVWWAYGGGIAIVGAMLGVIVPGVKAVKQDVTEALSYE